MITELNGELEAEAVLQDSRGEEAEITLYALIGNPTPGTMRVSGRIEKEGLVILLDSGSTHKFIDVSLLSKLHIPVDTTPVLDVKVANGTIIKTHGLCSDVLVVIQGQKFYVQLHVLSLGGCDLVLGTQWLSTLGVISWDSKLLTMSFMYCGHEVLLQGM